MQSTVDPAADDSIMITRIWRGWTTPADAAKYEKLLLEEILPGIARLNVSGYRGISLLKRVCDAEVEFVTMMSFDSLGAVRAFAGEDYEVAVVPPKARELLSRFDARSTHFEAIVPPFF